MDLTNLSSNWRKLQAQLQSSSSKPKPIVKFEKRKREIQPDSKFKSRKRIKMNENTSQIPGKSSSAGKMEETEQTPHRSWSTSFARKSQSDTTNAGASPNVEIGRYVAIDCEMVGVGPDPDLESALARVSIVNYDGEQIYDSYVKPLEPVTDWRTSVSGIQPKHMNQARTLEEVQQHVSEILRDRVLIGHSLRHDLDAMLLSHPKKDIRDTARHPPYKKLAGGGSPKLSILASELLGINIQVGEHSSIEDARACMMLFRRDKSDFEKEHTKRFPAPRKHQVTSSETSTQKPKSKKKKKGR